MFYLRIVSQALLTCFVLANLGCASSVTKPDVGSTDASNSAELGKLDPRANAEASGVTQDATLRNLDQKDGNPTVPESSSLNRMRAGKSTAASPSTPLKNIFFEFDRYDLTVDAEGQTNITLH